MNTPQKPKAYIAASKQRIADVRLLRDALAREGVELTCDWTDPRFLPHPETGDGKFRNLDAVRAASQVDGASNAEVAIVLAPYGKDTAGDVGAALAGGAAVVLVGDPDPDELYLKHELVTVVPDLESALRRAVQILLDGDHAADAAVGRMLARGAS